MQTLLAAFNNVNLVALGERHWAQEDSQFRLALLADPDFPRQVNDIVVEFANLIHQPILDRYIQGDPVPAAELQPVWRDTTQPGAFDSPFYEQFLNAVRGMNATAHAQVRVIAGDYPVDWTTISQPSDLDAAMHGRDRSAAEIIQREVLAKGHKALVLFGSAHLYRNRPGTIVDVLKHDPRATWFITVPVSGPGLTPTPAQPALLRMSDNPELANLPAAEVLEIGTKRIKLVDGKPILIPVFESHVSVGDLVDACLYFGAAQPEFVPPPPGLYAGTSYGAEVQRRRRFIYG